MTDYRRLNLQTIGSKKKKQFDSVSDSATNSMKLWKYSQLWNNLDPARRKRERAIRYSIGDQYSDIIKDEYGRAKTEGQHIMDQGKVPIANNLIGGQINTVIGQFLSNQTEPSCIARDRDEAKLGEMMSIAIQYSYQTNELWELDSETFREMLYSGVAIQKIGYRWNKQKQRMCEHVDMITLPRFFFNGDIEDPRGGDFTVMGEILDMSLADIITNFCAGDRAKAVEISKLYNNIDERAIATTYHTFNRDRVNDLSFFMPSDRSKCRVICAWEQEAKERLRVHDYLNGEVFVTELSDKAAIDRENAKRIAEATSQGVAEENVPLMEATWFLDQFWYVRYMAPTGEMLFEMETPYKHKDTPYVVKVQTVDGENYSFVDGLIELNRGINRLSTLLDFIISASPKGLMIFPEEALGAMNKNDIIQQYSMPGGVVFAKLKGLQENEKPYMISQNATNVGAYELLNLYMSSMKEVSGVYGAIQGQKASAGTPAAMYAQQAQQSATNLLHVLEKFKSFRQKRDLKLMQTIQQYYDTPMYINLAGADYSEESKWYNPKKIQDTEFDLVINESANTPAFRNINNSMLLDMFKMQAIGVKELLKAGNFAFGDKLLELISEQEAAMQQGKELPQVPAEMQQQIQGGMDPNAAQLMNRMSA